MSDYLLEMSNVHKSFPGVKALKGVELKVRPASVHALMGENGAGKSTLMKCLLGVYHMEEGQINLNGQEVTIRDPLEAAQHGIAMIHQELNPIPLRSVSDNIWVGRELRKGPILDQKQMRAESRKLLKRIGVDIDPGVQMGELSVSQMQMVEIAKAVSRNASIVVMDEPTSSLTEVETKRLFEVIKQLKSEGVGVIYISHKLDEIFQICDEVTVFRDGTYVGCEEVKNIRPADLIRMMVGRELSSIFPKSNVPTDEVILKIENLSSGNTFQNVTFELHRGEILGFAGLVGAGRTEVAETIFGIRAKSNGRVIKNGKELHIKDPANAIKEGIGLVTEDRRQSGIIPVSSVLDNISIAKLPRYVGRCRVLNHAQIKKDARLYGDKLRIKMPGYGTAIKNLSGGNQQKVLVARWLLTDPDVLIVDEPTRGIDVGAKSEIHEIISDLAKQGKGIIMISSEMPEVMGMSDRILVMHEGHMTGILDRDEFDQERILELASSDDGVKSSQEKRKTL